MTDTTDHAAAIRQAVIALGKHYIETGRLHSGRLDAEIDALAAENEKLRHEVAYWKSVVEDPVIYWGYDERPYGHLDGYGPDKD